MFTEYRVDMACGGDASHRFAVGRGLPAQENESALFINRGSVKCLPCYSCFSFFRSLALSPSKLTTASRPIASSIAGSTLHARSHGGFRSDIQPKRGHHMNDQFMYRSNLTQAIWDLSTLVVGCALICLTAASIPLALFMLIFF